MGVDDCLLVHWVCQLKAILLCCRPEFCNHSSWFPGPVTVPPAAMAVAPTSGSLHSSSGPCPTVPPFSKAGDGEEISELGAKKGVGQEGRYYDYKRGKEALW